MLLNNKTICKSFPAEKTSGLFVIGPKLRGLEELILGFPGPKILASYKLFKQYENIGNIYLLDNALQSETEPPLNSELYNYPKGRLAWYGQYYLYQKLDAVFSVAYTIERLYSVFCLNKIYLDLNDQPLLRMMLTRREIKFEFLSCINLQDQNKIFDEVFYSTRAYNK
jgi:hypothetical protein